MSENLLSKARLVDVMRNHLLEQIANYPEPALRYHLAEALLAVAASAECRSRYEKLIAESPTFALLLTLILVQLQDQGVNITHSFQTIAKRREFREASHKKFLIEMLKEIQDVNLLQAVDKSKVLNLIFKRGDDYIANLFWTKAVLDLEGVKCFTTPSIRSVKEAYTLAQKEAATLLFKDGNLIPNLDKYDEIFSRNPAALFIYASKVHNLPGNVSYKDPLLKGLKKYLQECLDGTFKERRYARSNDKHLQAVFPDEEEPLFETWKKCDVKSLKCIDKPQCRNIEINFETVVQDNFHDLSNLSHMNYVQHYLEAPSLSKERVSVCKELGTKIKTLQKRVKEKTIDATEGLLLQQLLFSQLILELARQKIDIKGGLFQDPAQIQKYEEEYRSKINGILRKIENICALGKAICPANEFLAKMKGMKKELPKIIKTVSYENWTITETDDPQDMLLCGTEIPLGSCQRVTGPIEYNKCLLAYLIDPKIHLLAIKDQHGKIRMRAIFKILLNEKGERVLFMEKIYPEIAPAGLKDLLYRYAKERAKEYQLPLVVGGLTTELSSVGYGLTVYSLGGPAPFEYVDALKAVEPKSCYKIPKSSLIYSPQF